MMFNVSKLQINVHALSLIYFLSLLKCSDNLIEVNTVYIRVSALLTLRKYNCNMQVRQIFKWHQVETFVMKTVRWRAEWAVWFCSKCASKYCMTFQSRHFACSLHFFNISNCGRWDLSLYGWWLVFTLTPTDFVCIWKPPSETYFN